MRPLRRCADTSFPCKLLGRNRSMIGRVKCALPADAAGRYYRSLTAVGPSAARSCTCVDSQAPACLCTAQRQRPEALRGLMGLRVCHSDTTNIHGHRRASNLVIHLWTPLAPSQGDTLVTSGWPCHSQDLAGACVCAYNVLLRLQRETRP